MKIFINSATATLATHSTLCPSAFSCSAPSLHDILNRRPSSNRPNPQHIHGNMSYWRSNTSSLTLLRSMNVALPHRYYATASKGSAGGTSDPAAYCSDFVKKYDPEAWLCHFFWPKDVRDLWLGWRAFNVSRQGIVRMIANTRSSVLQLEIHQVSASAKQPTIAMMRYQFWRDAIKAIWNVSLNSTKSWQGATS